MRWKLRTAEGRAIYSRRKVIVEPGFGLNGLEAAPEETSEASGVFDLAEWSLICLTHNLLKLYRAGVAAS